jgi:hypothetical protein
MDAGAEVGSRLPPSTFDPIVARIILFADPPGAAACATIVAARQWRRIRLRFHVDMGVAPVRTHLKPVFTSWWI